MNDIKMTCPGCSADVGGAFNNGRPCGFCGLSADAALAVIDAQRKGADENLRQRLIAAEKRADTAERQRDILRGILQEVHEAINEEHEAVWG